MFDITFTIPRLYTSSGMAFFDIWETDDDHICPELDIFVVLFMETLKTILHVQVKGERI